METIKKGSKGSFVKLLQIKLLISADGIFGDKTEAALKKKQEELGLEADGICGPKTWAALGVSKQDTANAKCIDSSVIYKPLPIHVTKCLNRDIKYLAIHYTGSSNSRKGRAENTYNTFMKRNASADFCVDDETMVQFNPDLKNYYCWAVGDAKKSGNGATLYGKAKNSNTISIEVCSTCVPATQAAIDASNHSGWSFTDAVLDNAVKLARMIMTKYNIPIERVVRHYDISGKKCPAIIGWNKEPIVDAKTYKRTGQLSDESKWKAFKERLK